MSKVDVKVSTANQITLLKDNWFDSSWSYRKKITFDNSAQAENLTDFPAMVKLTSSNFDFTKARSAGQDIRFTDSDGTTSLSYQLDQYSNTNQSAIIWVKVPQIDASSLTDFIYMYYGNAAASDGQSATSVWSSGFQLVEHFGSSSSLSLNDSTSNGFNGTNSGATATTGQLGGGVNFNGTNQLVSFGNVLNVGLNSFTMSGWINFPTQAGLNYGGVISKGGSSNQRYSWNVQPTNQPYVEINDGTNGASKSDTVARNDGNWHYVVGVIDRTGGTIGYSIDGSALATSSLGSTGSYSSTASLKFGAREDQFGSNAWYKGSLDEARIAYAARSNAYIAADYKNQNNTFDTFGSEELPIPTSGTLTSSIFDTASTNNYWQDASWTVTTPTGTSVTVKVRSSNDSGMSGATSFSSCNALTSGVSFKTNNCVTHSNRYLQYQLTLNTADTTVSPTFQSITFSYNSDTTAPPTNASSLLMKTAATGGKTLSSNDWNNTATPYFSWTAGADDITGSGLYGYCIYIGTTNGADPGTTSGLLTNSPLSTSDTGCGFITSSTSLDLSSASYLSSSLTNGSTYYFYIKAIDNAGNLYASSASFQFRQDAVAPTNVTSISTPGTSFSNVDDMFFSWPTSGGTAASDADSGLLGYQYQINSTSGTWLGTDSSSFCSLSYIPAATATYNLTNAQDGSSIVVGSNTVYFRTVDNACNTSSSATYRTGLLQYGGAAPSFGGGDTVTVTPSSSTTNSFALSWPAATASGGHTVTHYYYMINTAAPSTYSTITSNTATYIDNGTSRTVPAALLQAAVKGSNTVHVVATDDSNNYSASNAISGTFTLNSTLPDPPKNLSVADASIKEASIYRASLSWERPDYAGTGNLTYKIQRSTDGSSWSDLTTTQATTYTDTLSSSTQYYWRVGTTDTSAESIASPSYANAVTLTPKGKYTSPPNLVSGPDFSVNPTSLTVKWVTDRDANSFVEIKDGNTFVSQQGITEQVTSHTVTVVGLRSQKAYTFTIHSADVDGNELIGNPTTFTTASLPSIYDLTVTNITLTSAIINFKSTSVANFTLFYGKTTSYGSTIPEASGQSTTNHSISLTGLTSGTTYYYRIIGTDSGGNELKSDNSFATLPEPSIQNFQVTQVPDQPTTTLKLTWQTNVQTTTTAKYGIDGVNYAEQSSSDLTTNHEIILSNLADNTNYRIYGRGTDEFGNSAQSAILTFTTPKDTRAPKVSDIKIETSNNYQSTQILVAWVTDEPASSQVQYGTGASSTNYTNLSSLNSTLTTKHLVVLSNLSAGKPYHLSVLSADESGNLSKSADYTAVTGQVSQSALQIILRSLQSVFGWVKL